MRNKPYVQSITSYAFAIRGDLPPHHMGQFYRDTGLAVGEFQIAMAAQIVPTPQTGKGQDQSGNGWRTPSFGLPDPHPPFAPPNRKWREDGWFHRLRLDDQGRLMSREEFMKARETQSKSRKRSRNRNMSKR